MSEEHASRQKQLFERAFAEFGQDIEGRVAVVTGGARGIGKTLSQAPHEAGAKVALAHKRFLRLCLTLPQAERFSSAKALLLEPKSAQTTT